MLKSKTSFTVFILTICSTVLSLLLATNLHGQNDNLENYSIWKTGLGIKSKTIVINELQRKKIVIKNTPLLHVLSEGAEKILRLSKGDTIILISIPQIDNLRPEKPIQQITSVRMLLDDSKIGATHIDDFSVGPSTFGKKFFDLIRDQVTRIGSYAEKIHLKVLSDDPETLQIELTGGPYGDMTLVYTAKSPIPTITTYE